MVNGIINVYKEKGYTSFDVVAKLRGIFHQKKIGHTGTLDPDAQGVLPVCLGKATRVCDLLTDKDKVYKAVLLLGQETDTQDISGQVLNQAEVNVTEQVVYDAISQFIGRQKQVPPMYSALKVNGKKLYELAREGKVIERKARDIEVFDIKINQLGQTQPGTVHHLQHRAVTHRQRIVKIDIQQAIDIIDVDIFRQMTRCFWRGNAFRRVGFKAALAHQPVEETPQG